jgi:hypothetical protein
MRYKILKILLENTQVNKNKLNVISVTGCAMAQELSFWCLNSGGPGSIPAPYSWICCGHSANITGFIEVLQFSCQIHSTGAP